MVRKVVLALAASGGGCWSTAPRWRRANSRTTVSLEAGQRPPGAQSIDEFLVDGEEGWEEAKTWTLSNEALTRTSGEGNAFGDSRLCDLASDYMFPLAYVADMVVSLGARPPVRDSDRVSDLLDGEQAYALLEALNTLDGADLQAMYDDHTLAELAELMDVPVDELFTACAERGYSLPHGLLTQLRNEQVDELKDILDRDGVLVQPSLFDGRDDDDDA